MSGIRCARPHCNTDASAGYDDTGTFEHFSLLSEIIDHIRVVGNHVRWRIGIDLVHQSRPDLEADDHLVPTRALERRCDIAHGRYHALAGENDDFGRLGHSRTQHPHHRKHAHDCRTRCPHDTLRLVMVSNVLGVSLCPSNSAGPILAESLYRGSLTRV